MQEATHIAWSHSMALTCASSKANGVAACGLIQTSLSDVFLRAARTPGTVGCNQFKRAAIITWEASPGIQKFKKAEYRSDRGRIHQAPAIKFHGWRSRPRRPVAAIDDSGNSLIAWLQDRAAAPTSFTKVNIRRKAGRIRAQRAYSPSGLIPGGMLPPQVSMDTMAML